MRWVLVLVVLLLPAVVRADVAACVAAAEQGQVQRDERALGAARASFLTCVDAGCPAAVRKECAAWLADVEARLSSIVIAARDARGNDLHEATVWLDDRELAPGEVGRELTLDPGAHRLKARLGEREVQLTITASEREKGRLVTLALPDPAQPAKPPVRDAPPAPAKKPWLGPVITVSAGALLAGGAGLIALRARSDAEDLRDRCAPTCKASEVDALERKLRIADVMLVTGAVAVAAGVTWYVWPRKSGAKVGLTPSLGASRHAASMGLGGRF